MSMNVKLKNRKAAEEVLSDFIDHSTLPIELAEAIASPEINEDFLKAAVTLTEKLKFLQNKTQPLQLRRGQSNDSENSESSSTQPHYEPIIPSETHTGKLLLPDLEKLKMRCLHKSKEYFSKKFQELRKPKTNIQVLQQSSLLKYSKLLLFLQLEAPTIAEELRVVYIENMSRTLQSLFKAYCSQLLKLDSVIATKYDLIAVEEATLKSVFTQKVNLTKRTDSFALGERDRILDHVSILNQSDKWICLLFC